jgi:polyphosphate kinase 2 (PPK2 family)
MNVRSTDFRVEGDQVKLDKWPTAVEPIYESKKQYQKLLKKHVEELSSLQQLLYASSRYALLLIFQAMDAAGKDGAIRHVMSGVNPQGCQVFSYKHPSAMELQHDFLWRTTRDLPERGRIGIFNRSYYPGSLPRVQLMAGPVAVRSDPVLSWKGQALSGFEPCCKRTFLCHHRAKVLHY